MSDQITFSYSGPEATTSASTVGSEVNIAITGYEYQTTSEINYFEIVLYADQTAWDDWAAQRSTTDATDSDHYENYSAYAMQWYCNLAGVQSGTKDGSGCCLRDREDTEGGGYCIAQVSGGLHPDTYWMVEADFETAVTVSEYVLPSTKIVAQTTANKGFETFSCAYNVDQDMTCTKLQLWPAASYSGGMRFEKDKKVEAYFYDYSASGVDRWLSNQVFFLTGATSLTAAAVSLAALTLSVM